MNVAILIWLSDSADNGPSGWPKMEGILWGKYILPISALYTYIYYIFRNIRDIRNYDSSSYIGIDPDREYH